MSKIIIKNELGDSLDQEVASVEYVAIAIESGEWDAVIDDQYCFVTSFYEVQDVSDIVVYTHRTKNDTHVFRVIRRYL